MPIKPVLAVAAVAAALGVLVLLTPAASAGAALGPGGVARRVVKCADGGVKDTEVYVSNPGMGTITFTAKVVSAGGVGDPTTFTLQPMGLNIFKCTDFKSLYPGGAAFRRGVFSVESAVDVRVGSVMIARFKGMPVPNPDLQPLEPVG